MKRKFIVLIIISTTLFGCKAQSNIVDLSEDSNTSYLVSNITEFLVSSKSMFKGAFYINVFQMMDSKISPKNNKETEEILSGFLISMIPDGDYYTESNLIKISGFLNPKLVNIREKEYPNFEIEIEHGPFKQRIVDNYIISAKL